jgi:hypothetical protein
MENDFPCSCYKSCLPDEHRHSLWNCQLDNSSSPCALTSLYRVTCSFFCHVRVYSVGQNDPNQLLCTIVWFCTNSQERPDWNPAEVSCPSLLDLPFGKLTYYGKSQLLIGKSTISMGHFQLFFVSHNQRVVIPNCTSIESQVTAGKRRSVGVCSGIKNVQDFLEVCWLYTL